MATATGGQAPLKGDQLRDFSGGPNFRDSGPELAANEVSDAFNITFDERGGANSRLGYQKQNPAPLGAPGDKTVSMYWSQLLGKRITQSGKSLYLDDVNTARQTFTTAATVTFAETNTVALALHPADGLYKTADGVTWTKITAAPAGTCVAVWENRVYVGQPNGKLQWSDPATTDTWTATNFVELWERDEQAIVALHVGSGEDIQGRPGLLAFKEDSFYRVNEPTTGSYVTIDATVGAAGPLAVVGVGAKVCWVGRHGVYWWREDQAEAVNVSDRLGRLWRPDQANFAQAAGWCAGRRLDRALFSISRTGSDVNDLAFELHPDQGWLAPRSDAMRCYTTSSGVDETTFGGSVTADGQVYQLDTGGTDDGTAIESMLQLRWVEPNSGFQAHVWQIRVHGRGVGTVTVRIDYQDAGGSDRAFDLSPTGLTWGSFSWGSGAMWTPKRLQETQALYSIGLCRQFSLRFTVTSTDTAASRLVLDQQTAPPEVGSFGLYGVEYLYAQLGLS